MGKSQKGEALIVLGTKNSQVLGVTQRGVPINCTSLSHMDLKYFEKIQKNNSEGQTITFKW